MTFCLAFGVMLSQAMLATNWWPVLFQARVDWEEKIERIRIKVRTSFFMMGLSALLERGEEAPQGFRRLIK